MQPANGGVYAQQTRAPGERVGAVAAEFRAPAAFRLGQQAVIEVTREPTLGQDGTLADDKRVSFGLAYPRDSDPAVFYGSVSAGAMLSAGTYYFQWHTDVIDQTHHTTGNCPNWTPGAWANCRLVSPIYSFAVVAPTPAQTPANTPAPSPSTEGAGESFPLSAGDARAAARRAIVRRYGSLWRDGRARQIACRSTSYDWQRSCTATWRHGRWQYRLKAVAQEYQTGVKVKLGRLAKKSVRRTTRR